MTSTPTPYPTLGIPQIVTFNLLVFVWWLEVGLRISFLGAIRFEFLLAATATAMAILRLQARPRAPRKRNTEDNSDIARCIGIFIIVLVLSLPLALDFEVAWNAFFNRVAKLALIGILISQFVVSPFTLRIYLLTSLLAFMKIGQEAFVGKVTGNMVWENQGVPRLHGTGGTMFGHPNSLSGKTVSTLPWIWYLYPAIQRRWVKLLLAVQLAFAVNIVIFTASRTGYLTVIVAAILIVMFSGQKKGRLIALFIAAAVVTVVSVPQEYQDRFMSSFTGEEAEGQSSATRKALFFDSLETFAENPLGVGIACFRIYQAQHGRNAQDTHNLYTQLLAETGIQGFLCFIALLFVVLRKAFRCRRAFIDIIAKLKAHGASLEKDEPLGTELRDAQLLLATTTALIVFTLVRLVLGVFGHDFLEIYWWLAAGTAMALHNMKLIAEKRCAELTSTSDRPCGAATSVRSSAAFGTPRKPSPMRSAARPSRRSKA